MVLRDIGDRGREEAILLHNQRSYNYAKTGPPNKSNGPPNINPKSPELLSAKIPQIECLLKVSSQKSPTQKAFEPPSATDIPEQARRVRLDRDLHSYAGMILNGERI